MNVPPPYAGIWSWTSWQLLDAISMTRRRLVEFLPSTRSTAERDDMIAEAKVYIGRFRHVLQTKQHKL